MARCLLLVAALLPLDNRELMRAMARMVLHARVMRGAEVAAFVVRQSDGSLKCETWPETGIVESQQYFGAMPANTIAIVHTHPEECSAEPSATDVATAKRLRIPVYVLRRNEIYAAQPSSGEILRMIHARDWVGEAYRTPSIGER